MAEYKIRSSGKECIGCRRRFQVGESFYSVLRMEGEAVGGREDRCHGCWEAGPPPAGAVWWRTRRREERGGRARVDFASVRALFYQLLADPRPEIAGLRYVAALMLIRKRQLRLVDTGATPEGERLRVRPPGGEGRLLEVPVPVLDPGELERLKDGLKEALTLVG